MPELSGGAGLALCAAAAVLCACASAPVQPPAGADYRPAPQSALVTHRGVNHVVAQWQAEGAKTLVLAVDRPPAKPQPLAWLKQTWHGPQLQVSVQTLPLPWLAADRAVQQTAALEQLYSMVFRMEPEGRYCVGTGPLPCDAANDGLSHAQALQALARMRERAALRSTDAVAWHPVALQTAPVQTWDVDLAAVLVRGPEGPVPNLAIHFNRAPHSICTARTRADGVAICRLQDQHSDGQTHDHAAAVVVTFPGELRPDRVLLPTTHVLQGATATALPTFARPLLAGPPNAPRVAP